MDTNKYLQSINPYTNEIINQQPILNNHQIEDVVKSVHEAFMNWSQNPLESRVRLIDNLKTNLLNNKVYLAELITKEMGKLNRESIAEVEKCARLCDYYVNNAEKYLSAELVTTEAAECYVKYDPLGVLLAVMPWNFPLWQVFRFAIPAIITGNTILLKHASNVQMCGRAIEQQFLEAGFPENILTLLPIKSSQVKTLLKNDIVRAASLTGSKKAGENLAKLAGENIKPTVLELGGSDPFIVFSDANIEKTIDSAVKSRFMNAGQSCIAAKRFIVHSKIYDEFIELLTIRVNQLHPGDPMNSQTTLAPMAREDLRHNLDQQIHNSIDLGAKVVVEGGGEKYKKGYFYDPVILKNVQPGMRVFDEETFGPLVAVSLFNDEEEALRLANMSNFGLGASIWTENKTIALNFIHSLQAGSVFVNEFVKSDPRIPFGGIKQSGYGRELSHYGLHEFVNKKSVWIS